MCIVISVHLKVHALLAKKNLLVSFILLSFNYELWTGSFQMIILVEVIWLFILFIIHQLIDLCHKKMHFSNNHIHMMPVLCLFNIFNLHLCLNYETIYVAYPVITLPQVENIVGSIDLFWASVPF